MLWQACAAAVGWPSPRGGDRAPAVSVNVSGRQLMADSIVGTVAAALRETGLDPARLTVEITESALAEDDAAVSGRLGDLRGLGVGLAIDDFGTGYSSLGRLAHLPLDVLKIDKSFVDDITTDERSSALAAAVIALADSLGLATVAEGIETAPQRLALARLGCRAGQGYLFSQPVPAAPAGRLWAPALHAVGRQRDG